MATVWDGEVVGMRLALDSVVVSLVQVLLVSPAAIGLVRNAAACGLARTADLRAVVDKVVVWDSAGVSIRFTCVKAHVGVAGNECTDEMAKLGCERADSPW